VVTLIVSAGLCRRRGLYDPAVSDGEILVGVENPSDGAITELQLALEAAPGGRIKLI
jgi:hypothetical protein